MSEAQRANSACDVLGRIHCLRATHFGERIQRYIFDLKADRRSPEEEEE
jgi:hypothetical protein